MRRTAVLSESGLRELLSRLCASGRLMAPVKRGKTSFDFDWVESVDQVELEYVRTVLPPKKAFLPARETVLEFDLQKLEAKPAVQHEPFVLFGVHPCDLKGIHQLDWAMGQRHGVPDPHYLARREASTVVGIECLPDEYCFCSSVGSSETREAADLFLTPLESEYFVEILTEKGENLLKNASELREPTPEETGAAREFVERKIRSETTKINAEIAELPDLLEPCFDTDIFQQTALRCYSCGTCTNVCPTCFCYNVSDEVDLLLSEGTRQRTYDSCQFKDFAVVAGGHNFRAERTDRVRHRWFRKFVYLLREHGRAFCIGCGRCSKACTAGISLVDVLNSVLAQAREEVAK